MNRFDKDTIEKIFFEEREVGKTISLKQTLLRSYIEPSLNISLTVYYRRTRSEGVKIYSSFK